MKRLELEKPVLEAFWCWLEKLNVLKGSALFKAITYAKNQKPYLENICSMEDVRYQTTQLKMRFDHSQLDVRIGCFRIRQKVRLLQRQCTVSSKQQKPMVLMFILI